MNFRVFSAILLITSLFIGLILAVPINKDRSEPTFSAATIKVGSTGSDVSELQGRLKYLGYYNGSVDGVFGSKTRDAVTWFQWKFGLPSDGVVGAKTKQKLVAATKNWSASMTNDAAKNTGSSSSNTSSVGKSNQLGLTENDIQLMANAVYGEARGETYEGQVAVAAVILNRIKSPSFPDTVYGVIFQPRAFTAVADGQIYLTPNETAKRAVMDAINGWDPTYGCIYYFNPDTATSAWIWSRQQVMTIGKHIFCK